MTNSRQAFRLLLAQAADSAVYGLAFLVPGVSEHGAASLVLVAVGGPLAVPAVKLGLAALVYRFRSRLRSRLSVVALSAATASGVAGAGVSLAVLAWAVAR